MRPSASNGSPALCASVQDSGTGVPIVFLHGLVGTNEHWDGVAQRVNDRSRCLQLEVPLLDLDHDDCSVEGVTAITARFLTEYVREPAVLAGNSFGGHVALRLALERPELVKALVLSGSSGLFERTLFGAFVMRPSRAWVANRISELFFDPANVWESDIERAFAALTHRSCVKAMVRLSKSAKSDHLGERLGNVTKPTLLLWGKNDLVTPPEIAQEFHSLIPGSKLHWIDRCGHAPMMERPDEFAVALRSFITELDATRPA